MSLDAVGVWSWVVLVFVNVATLSLVSRTHHPHEPMLPGIASGRTRPHLVIAADVTYPPFAYFDPDAPHQVSGIGPDILRGMSNHCKIDIDVVQTEWSACQKDGTSGVGMMNGWFHACTTYTHSVGIRNRFFEFSESFTLHNRPAGLLVRAHVGVPELSPWDTLAGRVVVDPSWAPTMDALGHVTNPCTGAPFRGYDIRPASSFAVDGDHRNDNDRALLALLEHRADVVWLYGDQAHSYRCNGSDVAEWNCDLWSRFGSDFVYLHSGMMDWLINGTTITLAKIGSGIADIVNPCLRSYMTTRRFYDDCARERRGGGNLLDACVPNEHFPSTSSPVTLQTAPWMFDTPHHGAIPGYRGCAES